MTALRSALTIPASLQTRRIPCEPGHDVVYGLARGRGAEIYLAASNEFTPGLCAIVYAYDTATEKFRPVIDVAAATGFDPASGRMPHCKIHLSLSSTADGRAFAATHFTAPGVGQKDFEPMRAYRRDYPGCYLLEYDPASDRTHNHGCLLRGEGARISCLDQERLQYYFLSYPRNHLWRYDIQQRTLHDLGRVGQENSFGFEVDAQGTLFTTDDLGEILCYHPRDGRLQTTGRFLPVQPGRTPSGNYARRLTRGVDGAFYGITNKGARLFRLDPVSREVTDYGVIFGHDPGPGGTPVLPPGKAIVQTDARTLLIAFGGDGIYADGEPCTEFVSYDLVTRRTASLGKAVCPETGAAAWIAQCGLHVPQASRVFWGLQQTSEQLRLWSTADRATEATREITKGDAYRRHLEVIARQPFGASVEGRDRLPFVQTGWTGLRELGWRGEHRVIPADETAIGALCFCPPDRIYGVTCGERAHLFVYHPYRQNRFTENYEVHPWDLGVVFPHPVVRVKLFQDRSAGRLWIAGETAAGLKVVSYRVGAEQERYLGVFHSLPYQPPVVWEESPFQFLQEISAERLQPASLGFLEGREGFYGLDPAGNLIRVGAEGGEARPGVRAPATLMYLATAGTNRLVACASSGEVFCGELDREGAVASWRPLGSARVKPACHAVSADGASVAFGGADGAVTIFRLGPGEPAAVQSTAPRPVRALCWRGDGSLFGFCGREDEIGDVFVWRTGAGEIEVLGILQHSTAPRYWVCHRCDALAAGPRGEIYFGEHDRWSHLFWLMEGGLETAASRNTLASDARASEARGENETT